MTEYYQVRRANGGAEPPLMNYMNHPDVYKSMREQSFLSKTSVNVRTWS